LAVIQAAPQGALAGGGVSHRQLVLALSIEQAVAADLAHVRGQRIAAQRII